MLILSCVVYGSFPATTAEIRSWLGKLKISGHLQKKLANLQLNQQSYLIISLKELKLTALWVCTPTILLAFPPAHKAGTSVPWITIYIQDRK